MTEQNACPVCGGRGWHTAGGNDPMACGRCPAGEAFDSGRFDRRPLRCRLGLHTVERSQGVVGYCLRGCGDLKRHYSNGHTWTRYVEPRSERNPPPPPPATRTPGQSGGSMRAMTDAMWYQLAFECAGIGSGAVMALAPEVVMPSEVISESVRCLLEETYGIEAPEGYRK